MPWKTRSQVADLLYCDATEVVFTSGGTEANNQAIKGLFFSRRAEGKPVHVITSQIKHPAVLEPCRFIEILAVEMQAASLFAFGLGQGIPVGLVAHVTNGCNQSNEFDKGGGDTDFRIFPGVCRGARTFLEISSNGNDREALSRGSLNQAATRSSQVDRSRAAEGEIADSRPAIVSKARSLDTYSSEELKAAVAELYRGVATTPGERFNFPVEGRFAESVGYDTALLDRLPKGLWESFTGAGNPQPLSMQVTVRSSWIWALAPASICLYASKVGPLGKLYVLDLSQAMLDKAKQNLSQLGITNAELLHSAADAIPLSNHAVDLVTANGIYNLSPDKDAVICEVARVLKLGGRMIFAAVVLKHELPYEIRREINDWFRCIGGALVQNDFLDRLNRNGLAHPRILWLGRNARTGHELALSAVIRSEKTANP